MSDPFIGEVRIFAGNFAPRGWAFCNGQLLPISQNTALFSILGTTYGGDGRSTFALPNLKNAMPIGAGQGPGLSEVQLGESLGSASVSLLPTQIPAHTHAVQTAAAADSTAPTNQSCLAPTSDNSAAFRATGRSVAMSASAVAQSGQSWAHNNRSPVLALTFIIALQGTFPSRG